MSATPHLIIIGIDGGCWEYIDPLLARGLLPTIKQLTESGLRGVLMSTVPPITPTAWSSFVTGKNPGKHGLFDFLVRVDDHFVPFSSRHRHGTPFWTYLNRSGLRVGIVGIPATHPPDTVDGFMISGFGAPEASTDLTYPPELLRLITSKYGEYKVVVPQEDVDGHGLDRHVAATLDNDVKQTTIALDLTDEYRPDLLAFNFQSADQLNHYSRDYAHVEEALVGIDRNIQRIVEKYPDANFVFLSDHGSRRIDGIFLVRNWLVQQGALRYVSRDRKSLTTGEINHTLARLLQDYYGLAGAGEKVLRRSLKELFAFSPPLVRRGLADALLRITPYALFRYRYTDQIDWNHTRFYHLSAYGGFYVNHRDGGPGAPEYEARRQELMELLFSIPEPTDHRPLVQRIYKKEALYSGHFLDGAPDLVADLGDSSYAFEPGDYHDNVRASTLFMEPVDFFGTHKREGIFVLCGKAFRGSGDRAGPFSIEDIPSTVLHLFGVPVPWDYDGRVLTECLSRKFIAGHPVRYQPGDGESSGTVEYPYWPEGAESLKRTLRGLGYIG